MTDWFLYMVRCNDGTLYTGIATDVARRLEEHRSDGKKGAKYLRGRGPLALVFEKRIGPRSLASKVERLVKRLPKPQKEMMLNDHGQRIDQIIEKIDD